MGILNGLFKSFLKKECPRCSGKGHVDREDIKKLGKELKWIPGTCAYCNGAGKIDPRMENRVAFDTTYLTTNLPAEEKIKLINKDPDAMERAASFDNQIEDAMKQIIFLHFQGKLNPTQIADLFLTTKLNSSISDDEKTTLIDFIDRVIEKEKNKG